MLHIESHHFLPRWQMLLPQTTQLRENSLQMLSYRLSNPHTHDTLGEHDRDGWMGQEEMPAQSCCLQAVRCPQNTAHFQITPLVPVGAISSHTLTAAA